MANEIEKRNGFTPFVIMDQLDDEAIIAELEGRTLDVLVYHFEDKGQEIWGLSKPGVDEAKNELAKKGEVIRELEADVTMDDGYFYAKVKAGRYLVSHEGQEVLLDTAFGFKRQSKVAKSKWGEKENLFAYEQAAIKACRNASSRLIPEKIKQAVIEAAKQKGKVKKTPKTTKTEEKEFNFEKDLKDGLKSHFIGMESFLEWLCMDRGEIEMVDGKPNIETMKPERRRELIQNFDKAVRNFKIWNTQKEQGE